MGSQSLEEEYRNVTAQFRSLTEIRFKLLGFLPLGTAASFLWAKDEVRSTVLPFALFGLAVTVALAVYDARNDQLYDELVSRAGELERQLGLKDGSFAQRPTSWLKFMGRSIEHGWPVALIYAASAGLWLAAALSSLLRHVLEFCNVPDLLTCSERASVIRGASEIAIPLAVTLFIWRLYWSYRRNAKSENSRAKGVVHLVVPELARLRRLNGAITSCSALEAVASKISAGGQVDALVASARLHYYLSLPEYNEFTPRLATNDQIGVACACYILAAVVDLPARWIRDVHLGRR